MPNTEPATIDILLVEDSQALAKVYVEYLRSEPVKVHHVATGADALAILASSPPRVLLLDVQLPDMSGLDIFQYVRDNGLPCSVVIINAHGSVEMATDAIRQGAADFIEKPFSADRLKTTIGNVLDRGRLETIVENLGITNRSEYCGFIGSSLSMQSVYQMIDSAAGSDASIFVTGESGTGKEVCADAIHKRSQRRDKAFVAINCAAIPRDLMESEIFGHVKGAFTGAVSDREGAASRADGGTLFLDEIAEMDFDLQAKLLRFIQTGTFQKVGSSATQSVNLRFVCATNRDPLEEVREKRFREDLYYRLHVIPIMLPPLRDRGTDVIEIGERFLTQFAAEENKQFVALDTDVKNLMMSYPWPGNVRELQNVIRNIVVLQDGQSVALNHLPPALRQHERASVVSSAPSPTLAVGVGTPGGAAVAAAQAMPDVVMPGIRPLWAVEREAIEQAIASCDGNVPKAAAMLEVSPSTLYRKRQQWDQDAD